MTYLAEVHDRGFNPAFAVQEWLWQQYSSGDLVAAGGISAMPSMHVALATLFVLLGLVSVHGGGGNSVTSARRAECSGTWSLARA
jgi:hypothetical protein